MENSILKYLVPWMLKSPLTSVLKKLPRSLYAMINEYLIPRKNLYGVRLKEVERLKSYARPSLYILGSHFRLHSVSVYALSRNLLMHLSHFQQGKKKFSLPMGLAQ